MSPLKERILNMIETLDEAELEFLLAVIDALKKLELAHKNRTNRQQNQQESD